MSSLIEHTRNRMRRLAIAGWCCMISSIGSISSLHAFTWPTSPGEIANINDGETVEVTTAEDLAACAACDEIYIGEGATLHFTNLADNAILECKFTGSGHIRGTMPPTGNAPWVEDGCRRLLFKGDLSGFTGDLKFEYLLATFVTDKSGTFPMTFIEENVTTVQFGGGNVVYHNPIDFKGGANTGLYIDSYATLAGPITMRAGSIRGASPTLPSSGGTITGDITFAENYAYIEDGIKILGKTITANGGGMLFVDGGPIDLAAKLSGIGQIYSYSANALITFQASDLVPSDAIIVFGNQQWASGGALDLNGYDQKCGQILHSSGDVYYCTPENTSISSSAGPAVFSIVGAQPSISWPGTLKGHVSLSYEATTDNETLALTSPSHETDGKLAVKRGNLSIEGALPVLSGIEVAGTGKLTLMNSEINSGVKLLFSENGKLVLGGGVNLVVDYCRIDGAGLPAGEYNADSPKLFGRLLGTGILRVENDAPLVEGKTFVWTGAGEDDSVNTPGNWESGTAPLFNGTERLVFNTDVERKQAIFPYGVAVYAIDIQGKSDFTLSSKESDNATIALGPGGLTMKKSDELSAFITLNLNIPIELSVVPQTWALESFWHQLKAYAPWSGRASGNSQFTIKAGGRLILYANNSALETALTIENLAPNNVPGFGDLRSIGQPYIYHPAALGSPERMATFIDCVPRFINNAGEIVNKVPLYINSNLPALQQSYFEESNYPLYLDGKVTFFGGFGSDVSMRNGVHFRGGIEVENDRLTLRLGESDTWIENAPIAAKSEFHVDGTSILRIMTPGNSWQSLHVYKGTVSLGAENALDATGTVQMGEPYEWYSGSPSLDLGGFNQQVARFCSGINLAAFPDNFVTLSSDKPAILEIKSESAAEDLMRLKVSGAAGISFDTPGSLSFTNVLSDTAGTLQVKRGKVQFLAGSGWTAVTNIVLSGGTIAIGAGVGDTAFGPNAGSSSANTIISEGKFEIAAGEQITVKTLQRKIASDKNKMYAPGIYYGSEAAVEVAESERVDWIAGGGSVRVLRPAILPMMIMIR